MSNDTDGSEVVTKAIKRTWKHYFTRKYVETVGNVVTIKCIICEFVIIKHCLQCLKLARQYNSLLLKLTTTSMSNAVYTPTSSMFSYLVNESALPASNHYCHNDRLQVNPYSAYCWKRDIALIYQCSTGIIISGGNATVSADFRRVIAKGM